LDKAPDAFRTISEVAEEINVPQHVLRFWESRFNQIRPLKRGGGRRYYRPDDVDLLRGVRHLLYGEGYTIRGVQRILREQGLSFVQEAWRVDAELPPPELEDSEADEVETEVAARRADELPAVGFASADSDTQSNASPVGRREPVLTPSQVAERAPQRRGANTEDRRKLQTALDDLIACRRLLDAALAEDFVAGD
jgi:DNA-binding transcriptional MerR regulator